MAVQGVVALANLIPEIWSPKMDMELRNSIMFANFVERTYEADLKLGDTVRVNRVNAPTAESLTDDTASFNTQSLSTTQYNILVDKRVSAAFDISDLAQLQSISFQVQAQEALAYAVRKKLETDIIALLIPSSAAPDHQIAPASAGTLAAVDVASLRGLLSTALVPVTDRALFLSPSYYTDLMNSSQIMSRDFTNGNSSNSGVVDSFLGFQIMEHNLLGNDVGYAIHKSALQLVMQQEMRVKISDLHATGKYGYRISADLVWGATLTSNVKLASITG